MRPSMPSYLPEEQGDVGQRADGDEDDTVARLELLGEEVHGIASRGLDLSDRAVSGGLRPDSPCTNEALHCSRTRGLAAPTWTASRCGRRPPGSSGRSVSRLVERLIASDSRDAGAAPAPEEASAREEGDSRRHGLVQAEDISCYQAQDCPLTSARWLIDSPADGQALPARPWEVLRPALLSRERRRGRPCRVTHGGAVDGAHSLAEALFHLMSPSSDLPP